MTAAAKGGALERSLGVFSATTLIVGSMIGSGIFIVPSIMAGLILTPGVYLGLWLVAGALTLLGALSYGELSAMMPKAGGQYVFLREAFGPLAGFLYGWTLFGVIQSGLNAAVAIAFGKYLGGIGLPVGEAQIVLAVGRFTVSRAQLVAVAVIVLLTVINCRGVKEGAFVQNVFTVLKVGAILLLVLIGFGSGKGSFSHFTPLLGAELGQEGIKLGFLAAVGVAISKVFFAYDAWNTVTFAAEEVREPAKNLPRALVLGTVVTTLVYCVACAVFLYILPMGRMADVPENRVAAEVAGILMGPRGVTLVSIAILISSFGCVNGLILGGGRVLFAMARDGLFFPSCGTVNPQWHTPQRALVVQAVWSSILALSGSYSDLLTYVTFASLSFNALTVIGLIVLRRRSPNAERPYRTWAYPVAPLLYVGGVAFFLVQTLHGAPKDALAGVVIVLLGLPAYAFFRRRMPPAQATPLARGG
jgi:APA family basic amino acid/polyamine antiporter